MLHTWPCPDGEAGYAIGWLSGRATRVLVLPALFDEANKTRHFTVETMRLLDAGGVDCVLPDLPGCNESVAPPELQTVERWRAAAAAAATHFAATHVLAIRGGALFAPNLPGWAYAPVNGASLLRSLLRARVLSSKEAGVIETREALLDQGKAQGLELAGYRLGAAMITGLHAAEPAPLASVQVEGAGLWLRAEPDHNALQAELLAHAVLGALA